ncbi:TonB-dependent receptor domain-containing protein [Gilvimarinus chinensis]|uniref:TonB-dependent receptor domain-containing protein n=1 Tax=Gilvimarinus chinensis TaxID=396005 RepID=UPI0003647FAC|nr:TonB-dependent receptor [Gilvimarinus chinensis]
MKNNFKLSALSLAVLGAMTSAHGLSQEVGSEAEADDELIQLEEVVVTGFRQSIERAVDAKRNSDQVSDSIYAEDVGKSTDQNIADALSRVTGVTVTDEGGEGSRISVRGAASYMNQVSMNGVELTSGSTGGLDPNGNGIAVADQSVDLSAFSSDILASIDVVKTSSADQNEGSLGANVILRTLQPLDLNAPRRNVQVQQRYNDFSGEDDYALNGTFADKFFDDTVGFVFTTSWDNYKYRQDSVQTDWQQDSIRIVDASTDVDPAGPRAFDVATGQPIRVANSLNPDYNTLDKLPGYDPETQVGVQDLYVLARDMTNYSMSQNERTRWTSNMGIQIQPTDTSDIQLDVSYTNTETDVDYNTIRFNWAPSTAYSGYGSDTTDMIGIDLENRTIASMRATDRTGLLARTRGVNEIESSVVSLRWDQQLGDNLDMQVQAGWSKTTDDTDDWIGAGTATWGTTNNIENNLSEDWYDFVGYDCTTGDCSVLSGERQANYDPVYGTWNNIHSRFVPHDLYANHLGYLSQTFREQSDTNATLNLDFDWHVDAFHITDVEFGVKIANREKDVFTDRQIGQNSATLVDESNPDISYGGSGMDSIHVVDMLEPGAFPVDNFAEDLVENRSNDFFYGWPQIDPYKAVAAFTGADPDTVSMRSDPSQSRVIETDTQAAYLKGNFEFMEGRLTGNVGVRYVKDETEASAYGSIQWYRGPHAVDWYDLIVERQLANENLPACDVPSQSLAGPASPWENIGDLRDCWDWRITHAYDYDNDNTIPVEGAVVQAPETGVPSPDWRFVDSTGAPDYDVNRVLRVDYSDPNNPVFVENSAIPSQIYEMVDGELRLTGYKDRLRTRAFRGGLQPYVDYATAFTGPAGNTPVANFRNAETAGSGSFEAWLPSLNLNYMLTEDMILRFATSKTMARPRFDSLAPRLQINENQWDSFANGSSGNTSLKPLESKNLDLSYEWYFGEGDMLSVALFHKDMDNFEEDVDTRYYYQDVRSDYDLDDLSILLPYDESIKPGDVLDESGTTCMPHRAHGPQSLEPVFIDCHTAIISQVQNGDGQTITGVELGYTQMFDSLPDAWSGLGLSMNYTYQESERDPVRVDGTDYFSDPLPAANTPKHTANTTVFWEYGDWELRLAHQYTGIQLVDGGTFGGAVWQDPTENLDFSSTYNINDTFSLTFHALNITDEITRQFYTARNRQLGDFEGAEVWDEGNPMDDSGVYDGRTDAQYRIGRSFRLALRMSF